MLVITYCNPDLTAAVTACFPSSCRQRCTFHKKSKVLDKVPEAARDEVKSWPNSIYRAPNLQTCEKLAADFIAT